MRNQILSLLEKNAKLTAAEIAVFLNLPEADVQAEIQKLEQEQIICGYGAIINWERTDSEFFSAMIEVKVTPSRGQGFHWIAERIYRFDEVQAVYLMSGTYDLAVVVHGKSLKDIAYFVSDKLTPLDTVVSTATCFMLKKYKDHGVIFAEQAGEDERMIVSP